MFYGGRMARRLSLQLNNFETYFIRLTQTGLLTNHPTHFKTGQISVVQPFEPVIHFGSESGLARLKLIAQVVIQIRTRSVWGCLVTGQVWVDLEKTWILLSWILRNIFQKHKIQDHIQQSPVYFDLNANDLYFIEVFYVILSFETLLCPKAPDSSFVLALSSNVLFL